jgi:hypothetical protein
VRAFLLVEAPGAWQVDAVRDCVALDGVRRELVRRTHKRGVRVLLVRRHGRHTPTGVRVFAAWAHPALPWMETTLLDSVDELLDLDLESLGAGRSPGLVATKEPVFAVCTHGRHDVCCAERGRPVAKVLERAYPDLTWEVSHIGGDRFAANVLVLPQGLYYGRVDPSTVAAMAAGHLAGELDLAHLRGRSGYPVVVQAAEWMLRTELGLTRNDALVLAAHRRPGQRSPDSTAAGATTPAASAAPAASAQAAGETPAGLAAAGATTPATAPGERPVDGAVEHEVDFLADGRRWRLRVEVGADPRVQLTCRVERLSAPPAYRLIDLSQVSG